MWSPIYGWIEVTKLYSRLLRPQFDEFVTSSNLNTKASGCKQIAHISAILGRHAHVSFTYPHYMQYPMRLSYTIVDMQLTQSKL